MSKNEVINRFIAVICGIFLLSGNIGSVWAAERDVAFGLNDINDWSPQAPFIDVMKTARPWIGHLHGQWGGVEFDELLLGGHLDENGWPVSFPPAVRTLEALLLTDQPESAEYLAGRYHLTYEGRGRVEMRGRARTIRRSEGTIVFDYNPGDGHVGVAIYETDPADHIRNVRIVHEDHMELAAKGAVFRPEWLARLRRTSTLRFMDWMKTNNSSIKQWEDRPKTSDFSFAWRGAPLEIMTALANELNADPWFTLPHAADDAFVRKFAERVRNELDEERTVYAEYSNEVWNFLFKQARWADAKASTLWGNVDAGWVQFYGMRAAQTAGIWAEVFGRVHENRLVRVVSVQTGWLGLENAILFGEAAKAELGSFPAEHFDAYAVTGYFGSELGDAALTQGLFTEAELQASITGMQKGLRRVSLREYVRQNRFKGVNAEAADLVRRGSLKELTEVFWPYHAKVAQDAGLALIMYEGGTHAVGIGDDVNDERLTDFLTQFNYSPEMADLYREAICSWVPIGSGSFNAFVDVAQPSKWGSWGALRHLADQNPRWTALTADHAKCRQ